MTNGEKKGGKSIRGNAVVLKSHLPDMSEVTPRYDDEPELPERMRLAIARVAITMASGGEHEAQLEQDVEALFEEIQNVEGVGLDSESAVDLRPRLPKFLPFPDALRRFLPESEQDRVRFVSSENGQGSNGSSATGAH